MYEILLEALSLLLVSLKALCIEKYFVNYFTLITLTYNLYDLKNNNVRGAIHGISNSVAEAQSKRKYEFENTVLTENGVCYSVEDYESPQKIRVRDQNWNQIRNCP